MKKQASGWTKLPGAVRKGIKKSLEGESPFVLAPFNWAAKKVLGDKKVNQAYWKYFQKPIVKADVNLGTIAQKATKSVTGGKGGKLWSEKKILPTGRKRGLFKKTRTGGEEHHVPSVLAPASKTGKFVIPMLGAMKLEEILKGKKPMSNKPIVKEADLKKVAEMLNTLNDERNKFKKEAKATELIYKQAEMGQVKFPETFAEYQEKVAELLGKNLDVVEEAIKMASSSETDTLGGLDNTSNPGNAQDAFQRAILN